MRLGIKPLVTKLATLIWALHFAANTNVNTAWKKAIV